MKYDKKDMAYEIIRSGMVIDCYNNVSTYNIGLTFNSDQDDETIVGRNEIEFSEYLKGQEPREYTAEEIETQKQFKEMFDEIEKFYKDKVEEIKKFYLENLEIDLDLSDISSSDFNVYAVVERSAEKKFLGE